MTDVETSTPTGSMTQYPGQTSAVDNFLADLASNLAGGWRLITFRSAGSRFRTTSGQAIALVLLDIAITLLCDLFSTEPPRVFSNYGPPVVLTQTLSFLPILWLLSFRRRPGSNFTALIVTIYSGLMFVGLATLVFIGWVEQDLLRSETVSTPGSVFAVLSMIVAFVAIARGSRLHLVGGWFRTLARTAVAIGGLAIVSEVALPDQYIWYADLSDETDEQERVNVERIYYQQGRLVHEAVNAMADERPGVHDLYFVAAAPDANEDVFRNEVRLVRALFDDRFDTLDRSILLINDPTAPTDQPLANFYNLQNTFYKIGKRINPDEDLVFVFLTSHGYKQAALSANMDGVDPNALWADDIKLALDRSAIKWRVLVISACYSGSFIEHLADDNTLIITASHKDRTSFGCENGRDYTEFGKALFDEQLRQKISFLDAFEAAKVTIKKREIARDLTPSQPQISLGPNIGPYLDNLFDRLKERQNAGQKLTDTARAQ